MSVAYSNNCCRCVKSLSCAMTLTLVSTMCPIVRLLIWHQVNSEGAGGCWQTKFSAWAASCKNRFHNTWYCNLVFPSLVFASITLLAVQRAVFLCWYCNWCRRSGTSSVEEFNRITRRPIIPPIFSLDWDPPTASSPSKLAQSPLHQLLNLTHAELHIELSFHELNH